MENHHTCLPLAASALTRCLLASTVLIACGGERAASPKSETLENDETRPSATSIPTPSQADTCRVDRERKTANCKIVYFGPAAEGRAILMYIHKKANKEAANQKTSLREIPRPGGFDFLPLALGTIAGLDFMLHLYRLSPDTIGPNDLWKDVDGVVFIASATKANLRRTSQHWNDLQQLLREQNKHAAQVPVVLQLEVSADAAEVVTAGELRKRLQLGDQRITFSRTARGSDVMSGLKAVTKVVATKVKRSSRP